MQGQYARNYSPRNYGGNFSYDQRGYSVDRSRPVGKPKGRSGARLIQRKDGGRPFISAWKASRQGFLVVTANYWKDAKSEKYDWECWVVNILNRNTGAVSTHTGLYNPSNGKLRIQKLNWVINPRAINGGYCGRAFSGEYRPKGR